MKRKPAATREAVSFIFQIGRFGQSEYTVPRDTQLSLVEPESAIGNHDGFPAKPHIHAPSAEHRDETAPHPDLLAEAYFNHMRVLPCFDGMSAPEIHNILQKRAFHIHTGDADINLAVLESLFEMRQKYGLRKFLLLTNGANERDRFAETFSVMRAYFSQMYYGLSLNIIPYDSENPRSVRSFALSEDIELLIINKDAFVRENNLIRRASSLLNGATPVSLLSPAHCVVVTISENLRGVTALLRHADIFDPLCSISFTQNGDPASDIPLIDLDARKRQAAEDITAELSPDEDDLQMHI